MRSEKGEATHPCEARRGGRSNCCPAGSACACFAREQLLLPPSFAILASQPKEGSRAAASFGGLLRYQTVATFGLPEGCFATKQLLRFGSQGREGREGRVARRKTALNATQRKKGFLRRQVFLLATLRRKARALPAGH
jgi:hypothetical protein